jgi:hypothetical protein
LADPVLRLFRFRVAGSPAAFDSALRDRVMPRFVEQPGLLATYVGRRGAAGVDERMIASVWESHAAIRAAADDPTTRDTFSFEVDGDVADPRLETIPLRLALGFDPRGDPQILRVFRGEVKPGEDAQYLEDVRAGVLSDVEAGHGPQALFLGFVGSSAFVTMSAWASWRAIESATGGNIRRPVATRNTARLTSGTADHYEIVPEIAGRAFLITASVD